MDFFGFCVLMCLVSGVDCWVLSIYLLYVVCIFVFVVLIIVCVVYFISFFYILILLVSIFSFRIVVFCFSF